MTPLPCYNGLIRKTKQAPPLKPVDQFSFAIIFSFHFSEQKEMLFLIPHSFTYKVKYEIWCLISGITSSYKLSQNSYMYFTYFVKIKNFYSSVAIIITRLN